VTALRSGRGDGGEELSSGGFERFSMDVATFSRNCRRLFHAFDVILATLSRILRRQLFHTRILRRRLFHSRILRRRLFHAFDVTLSRILHRRLFHAFEVIFATSDFRHRIFVGRHFLRVFESFFVGCLLLWPPPSVDPLSIVPATSPIWASWPILKPEGIWCAEYHQGLRSPWLHRSCHGQTQRRSAARFALLGWFYACSVPNPGLAERGAAMDGPSMWQLYLDEQVIHEEEPQQPTRRGPQSTGCQPAYKPLGFFGLAGECDRCFGHNSLDSDVNFVRSEKSNWCGFNLNSWMNSD